MTQFAVCVVDLKTDKTGKQMQLMPAGAFAARDGRPGHGKSWHIDERLARRVIAAAELRQTPFVIDYEHQTLHSKQNGRPAPAAGWFKTLEWRDGQGLWATDVKWTEAARAMIDAEEYRFISPVFSYAADGAVLELHMAALTNYPAIDGMEMLAAAKFQPDEEVPMNKELLLALGLAEDADEQAVLTAVIALKAALEESTQKVTALKAQPPTSPDPAKYVPVEIVTQIQGELAVLRGQLDQQQVDKLVTSALASGRLLPAMETWARELGGKDIAALKGFVDNAQPIAALTGMQSGGAAPGDEGAGALDETALAVCRCMGISHEDYQKTVGQ